MARRIGWMAGTLYTELNKETPLYSQVRMQRCSFYFSEIDRFDYYTYPINLELLEYYKVTPGKRG